MILRPRQNEFVEKCLGALSEHGNTLGVAPTGAGKTVMLSKVVSKFPSSLLLQHRDELVDQNFRTFKKVNPNTFADLFTADRKRFLSKGVTFAMVQTLMRPKNMERIGPIDLLAIDEAHHCPAKGYQDIINRCKEVNPQVKVLGVTATPMRADKKALRGTFDNVADVITLAELIQAGHLVRPRTFVVDCGLREDLKKVRITAADFDMDEVAEIMDKIAVNNKVVEEWQKVAGDRGTIVFCSTVEHAEHVTQAFKDCGISAAMIHGDMADCDRKRVLSDLDRRELQVVVNVAVLTEGFDCQHVSCVILLRPCSHKSTMLQMIGRGLRKVDPQRYPGVIKDDCIVLDFGYSILTHGNLDIDPDLSPEKREPKPMLCPTCQTLIPPECDECPVCGTQIIRRRSSGGGPREAKGDLEEFVLTEVEVLEASPYRWEDFWDGIVTIADGMTAWAACVYYKNRWVAVGGVQYNGVKVLSNSDSRFIAISSADDHMREFGDSNNASKAKTWLSLPATDKQIKELRISPTESFGLNRYRASCQITWKWNQSKIRSLVEAACANT